MRRDNMAYEHLAWI